MTDIRIMRRLDDLEAVVDRLKVRESGAIYLSFAQRALNPFPLASSGGVWGDIGQPWNMTVLTFYASVFISTTNDGSNFWTFTLISTAATTVASLSTAAVAANTYTRLSTTIITQPASSNAAMSLILTATGSPGAIFIVPTLAVARTG